MRMEKYRNGMDFKSVIFEFLNGLEQESVTARDGGEHMTARWDGCMYVQHQRVRSYMRPSGR